MLLVFSVVYVVVSMSFSPDSSSDELRESYLLLVGIVAVAVIVVDLA